MNILLLGKTGQVGWELGRSLALLGELIAPDRHAADLEHLSSLRELIRDARPDIVVNAAAYTAVDKAETEAARARRINFEAVEVMAEEARRSGAWLVHYSTDYIFDGKQERPYLEDDSANPLSVYGKTKWEGEQAIRGQHDRHLILRTSWVYGAWGNNFPKTILRLAKERPELRIVSDQHGAPTSAELIADVTAAALHRIFITNGASTRQNGDLSLAGTYHLAAAGETTWYDYARYVVELAAKHGVALSTTVDRIQPIPTDAYPVAAARPKNSRLDTTRLSTVFQLRLPEWRYQVRRLVQKLTRSEAA